MESMWVFDFQLRNLYPYCDRCTQGRRRVKWEDRYLGTLAGRSSVKVEGLRGGTLLAVTASQRASKQGIRGGDFGCAP
jgi:DNA topoisomerase IB